mmetsp:Transcript_60112/g.178229  ORF Transcript_60112/g.178229 Transcript_60112/m.178229 type:complete len:140 (-) Transcript_60112:655-1074(-)
MFRSLAPGLFSFGNVNPPSISASRRGRQGWARRIATARCMRGSPRRPQVTECWHFFPDRGGAPDFFGSGGKRFLRVDGVVKTDGLRLVVQQSFVVVRALATCVSPRKGSEGALVLGGLQTAFKVAETASPVLFLFIEFG